MLFKRFCAFFCFFALAALYAAVSYAGTVNLKLAHTAEPNTPLGFGVEKLAELAHEYSDGSLTIRVFHSGQLGNERELAESLHYGTLDMALIGGSLLAEYVPEMRAFELPFIFRNSDHAYAVLDSAGMATAEKGERWGLKPLAMMERSQRHLCSGRAPFKDPRDLRGVCMRIRPETGYSQQMLFYMGARPVYVAETDLDLAAANGDVDGQECTLGEVLKNRRTATQKFLSLTAHRYEAEAVLVSMATWNRLTPEHRKALALAARDATEWQRALCRKQNTDYLLKIHDQGLARVILKIDRQRFERASLPVWRLFASELASGQTLIDSIRRGP